jgi:hypothetical protein
MTLETAAPLTDDPTVKLPASSPDRTSKLRRRARSAPLALHPLKSKYSTLVSSAVARPACVLV